MSSGSVTMAVVTCVTMSDEEDRTNGQSSKHNKDHFKPLKLALIELLDDYFRACNVDKCSTGKTGKNGVDY